MATLDRIFIRVDSDSLFPTCHVKALPRVGSDHTPLVLDTATLHIPTNKMFRFEKWWPEIPGFDDVIDKAWNTKCHVVKAIDIWQFKIRTTRKVAKGWCANFEAAQNNMKQALVAEYNCLDILAESQPLSPNSKQKMKKNCR